MLHGRYFCKKNLLKRKLTDKVEDECNISRLVYNESNDIVIKPLHLTTLSNQSINKTISNPNSSTNTSTSSIYHFTDLVNSQQNSTLYVRYLQNLNSLLNSTNITALQNQVKNLNPSLNRTSSYSIPELISSISTNNTNYKKQEGMYADRSQIIASSSNYFMNNNNKESAKSYQKTKCNSMKTKSEKMKTNESITPVALNFQVLQNCCAKCNTQFRLTSDLVYHMRTFHRRDDSSYKNEFKLAKEREEKKLKCEICNENFKEKHHLTRHMTSHR